MTTASENQAAAKAAGMVWSGDGTGGWVLRTRTTAGEVWGTVRPHVDGGTVSGHGRQTPGEHHNTRHPNRSVEETKAWVLKRV